MAGESDTSNLMSRPNYTVLVNECGQNDPYTYLVVEERQNVAFKCR